MPKAFTPLARWTPRHAGLPVLSVRQPWAWLIVNGFKDVENRPRRTLYRGPLLIQAGANRANFTEEATEDISQLHGLRVPDELDFGGIVGVVDVVDCVTRHPSPWHERGLFAWVLENPRRLPFRECKGQLGLFRLPFGGVRKE